jgi:hypothetical protein
MLGCQYEPTYPGVVVVVVVVVGGEYTCSAVILMPRHGALARRARPTARVARGNASAVSSRQPPFASVGLEWIEMLLLSKPHVPHFSPPPGVAQPIGPVGSRQGTQAQPTQKYRECATLQ